MKLTGYKIKEAIKAYERLLEDIQLVATAVPRNHEQKDFPEKAEALLRNLTAIQVLNGKLVELKKLQLAYNAKVKVNETQTLAEVIQDTTLQAKLVTQLSTVLSSLLAAERGHQQNAMLKTPQANYPQGAPPRHDVPVIDKTIVQKAVRELRLQETRLKNLVGYGNGVEIDIEADATLFDEKRWQTYDFEVEADQDHRIVMNLGIVAGIPMDLDKMNRMIDDVVEKSETVRQKASTNNAFSEMLQNVKNMTNK